MTYRRPRTRVWFSFTVDEDLELDIEAEVEPGDLRSPDGLTPPDSPEIASLVARYADGIEFDLDRLTEDQWQNLEQQAFERAQEKELDQS